MHATTALKGASVHGGPMVFGAGLAMLVAALTASERGPVTASPRPAPTVTVTSSAAPSPVVGRTPRHASPSPSSGAPAVTQVVPADESTHAPPDNPSGGGAPAQPRPHPDTPSGTGPSKPSPSPSAAAQCRGALADAQFLHVLCVTVGGSR